MYNFIHLPIVLYPISYFTKRGTYFNSRWCIAVKTSLITTRVVIAHLFCGQRLLVKSVHYSTLCVIC